ncbi:glyoxalase/bleomycin resistance/extradiol dioxygenase family protein [Mucilaginibacter pallidiroseus]|uniref:Glyoxalase/bleomycin resistance/extradiol dioxygenase family protein n=1 Tax=Mucilaginibacter pallidiroseus TaxID=2599295 RepID=A0A563U4Z2_9SPHI|nr:VOC family protein [Mucilaginibacter pallidiroseus]TWR26416.1 glyoxalase/bleomycin resistance/extradiol dioxygenase family protein [Mucilaginibacter pallidiroseus]
MATQIFVNLPVTDLNKSVEFFTRLGYTFNPQFTDEKATCMIVSDTIYVMLLTRPFFQTFTKKEIIDAHKQIECTICLSTDSKVAVDDMVAKAEAAGATIPNPATDYGFMYQHSFADLDGHHWEVMWMDPAGPPQQA